jgi:hypothetical protein
MGFAYAWWIISKLTKHVTWAITTQNLVFPTQPYVLGAGGDFSPRNNPISARR